MRLNATSSAIIQSSLEFGRASLKAKSMWPSIVGLSKTEHYWEGSRLHFLTESIHPQIKSLGRPRVLLLFSNPHPESVNRGLFMSEPRSVGFWKILADCMQPKMDHEFRWDPHGIAETVSILLDGNYKGPLLFFDCLYELPSISPKDLKSLFSHNSDDFQKYLHRPSLARIRSIIDENKIKTVLVFTGETYESIVDRSGISKGSRNCLHSHIQNYENEDVLWESLTKLGLMDHAQLSGLESKCKIIKIMDTRAKNWWFVKGKSVFSHMLEHGLNIEKESIE
jgi:hypothetical protein